jgi:5-methylcytosine-specific restriction endonuclease McrA
VSAKYAADIETSRERARAKYAANPDAGKRASRRWQIKNPDRRRATEHRKRARKRDLPEQWTHADAARALKFWKDCCAVCRTPVGLVAGLEWDHWIPLSSPDCPGTVPKNLLPMCQWCNRSKHHTMPEAWLRRAFPNEWRKILRRIESYFMELKCPTP